MHGGHPRPLRVVMVLKRSLGRGGLQQQARRVALRMRRGSIPVTLVTHTREPMPRPRPQDRALPTRWLRAPNQWAFAAELFRWLYRHRAAYDVVHVHGFGLESFAALAARAVTRKPVVIKPSTAGKGTKLDVYARLTRWLPFLPALVWRKVDAWVSISEQTRGDLLRLGVPSSRIADIPNGVNTEVFRPADPERRAQLRAMLGAEPGDVVFCTAARLSPHKRVDLVVRAFLALLPRYPRARLWVLGHGEQYEELRALAAGSPGGERVTFMGHVKPWGVIRCLQAADVFVLVSLWEGLSNALLEAMACGLAPVVTDVSGMADVVRHEVTGVVVPPDDQLAVEEAFAALLDDPRRREALGAAAAEFVVREYGLDTTVARLLALYREVQP